MSKAYSPSPLLRLPREHPALSFASVTVAVLFFQFRQNYLAWLSLGRGGVPYNPIGWLINWLLYPLSNGDTNSLAFYDHQETALAADDRRRSKFLDAPLPPREQPPPEVPNFVAPQRQSSQQPAPAIRDAQKQAFEQLARRNQQYVQIKTSQQEGHGAALWLSEECQAQLPAWARATGGEIAHVHWSAEGSAHCTLSLGDAREVVAKGWGRRHPLSGMRIGLLGRGNVLLSAGYTMVYAPRTEEELAVQMKIFEAAIRCMSG